MEKVFILTVDGTSTGYYEHCAFSLLFKTLDDAKSYVEDDFREQVKYAGLVSDGDGEEEYSKAIKKTCRWLNGRVAKFRKGSEKRDYEITEELILSNKKSKTPLTYPPMNGIIRGVFDKPKKG